MAWIGAFGKTPKHVFVMHGNDTVTELFAGRIQNELGLQATAPYNGESWDLTQDVMVQQGNTQRIKRKYTPAKRDTTAAKTKHAPAGKPDESAAYTRLLQAGERMADLIEQMQRSSKKNQRKLASALFSLAKRYHKR